jgi:HAD superfamily hydrolase (TIGR01509 family)
MAVAAILDLDGTLVTFTFDVRGTRQVIIGEMNARGFETEGLDQTTPTQLILDAAMGQVPPRTLSGYAEFRKEVFAILDRFELQGAERAYPLPGVADALRYLKSKGVRLAVLTNSGRIASSESLSKAGLEGFFEFVLTRDDTETMKPRPEGLSQAAAMLQVPKEAVYYVGDSPYDIIAARQAGIHIVSVATGNYTMERLRADGADHVIPALSELPRVLGV